jgi:hypothetical protein
VKIGIIPENVVGSARIALFEGRCVAMTQILASCVYLSLLVAAIYFTRATARRVVGALGGGGAVALVGAGVEAIAHARAWWSYSSDDTPIGPVGMYPALLQGPASTLINSEPARSADGPKHGGLPRRGGAEHQGECERNDAFDVRQSSMAKGGGSAAKGCPPLPLPVPALRS